MKKEPFPFKLFSIVASFAIAVGVFVPNHLIKSWFLYIGPASWLVVHIASAAYRRYYEDHCRREGRDPEKITFWSGIFPELLGFIAGPVVWVGVLAYQLGKKLLKKKLVPVI